MIVDVFLEYSALIFVVSYLLVSVIGVDVLKKVCQIVLSFFPYMFHSVRRYLLCDKIFLHFLHRLLL